MKPLYTLLVQNDHVLKSRSLDVLRSRQLVSSTRFATQWGTCIRRSNWCGAQLKKCCLKVEYPQMSQGNCGIALVLFVNVTREVYRCIETWSLRTSCSPPRSPPSTSILELCFNSSDLWISWLPDLPGSWYHGPQIGGLRFSSWGNTQMSRKISCQHCALRWRCF